MYVVQQSNRTETFVIELMMIIVEMYHTFNIRWKAIQRQFVPTMMQHNFRYDNERP